MIEEILKTQIKSKEQAIAHLNALYDNDLLFHLDDRAADIVWQKTYERVFSNDDAKLYDERIMEVFKYIDDPYDVCLEIMGV